MEVSPVFDNRQVKWGRALLHFSLYIILVIIYESNNLDERSALGVFAIAGIVIVGLDILRFSSLGWKEFVNDTLTAWNIIKKDELSKISGLSIGVLGMAVVMVFMDKRATIFAALCVASIDPAARVGGTLFGRNPIYGKKTVQGTGIGICAGLLTIVVYYSVMNEKWGMLQICGVVSAAFAELWVKEFDNFVIPITAAGAYKLAALSTYGWV